MKKNIFIIAISILIVIVSMYIFLLKDKYKAEDNSNIFSNEAEYIWIDDDFTKNNNENIWACFRKNFIIKNSEDISNVNCRILVDSKYWLYINGKLIIRDGQLKNSEKENTIFYDELNISDYLTVGENNISILVWYYGKTSFSHIDSRSWNTII